MKIPVTRNMTLAELLKESFPQASHSTLKKWILHGAVTINGRKVTRVTVSVTTGDVVEYLKHQGNPREYRLPFPVLFEDDAMIAVEKPAGMLTYGVKGSEGTSVYRELLYYIRTKDPSEEKVYVVHRLDREVSGVLLFARSERLQEKIKESWHLADKRYQAVVKGAPPQKEGTVRSWMKENKAQRVFSVKESPDAKLAVTRYRLLKALEGHSLLEIRLETGRKHQIRVHMADLGCQVAGDRKYSSDGASYDRIRLHAFYLSVIHPVSGQRVEIRSPLPEGFLKIRKIPRDPGPGN